jgi:Glutamine synthetase
MFQNADEAKKFIADEDVKFVDVRFCDLPGVMQHFTIPAEAFDPAEELAFDGSSIRGFQAIHESDMALRADLSTARVDPFRRDKTVNINFFIHDPITGEQYSRDPRNVAKKAEAYLASTGIADTAFFGPEAEFYVFDSVRFDPSRTSPSTTSTPRRPPGTPAPARTTGATRSATRAATSRPRRSTTSPTCAPRSPWSWRHPACRSSASTTRSAPPARRRSTTSSTRCSPRPTT